MNDCLIPPAIVKELLAIVQGTSIRVDLLLETMTGAISLLEYASGAPNLLLRTVNGPSLIPHPLTQIERPLHVGALTRP